MWHLVAFLMLLVLLLHLKTLYRLEKKILLIISDLDDSLVVAIKPMQSVLLYDFLCMAISVSGPEPNFPGQFLGFFIAIHCSPKCLI